MAEALNDILDSLSEAERQEVLSILGEIADTGSSKKFDALMKQDYDEIPVSITEFISNKEYLGGSFGGGDNVYPFWKEKLTEIFEDKVKYSEIIFTGGIGLGKTTIAIIGILYTLYGLMCLKCPQTFYGLPETSKIVIAFFNITLDLSFGVAYKKMQDYLMNSPWFMSHGTVRGNKKKEYVPSKNIEFRIGSRTEHSLGQDVFCLEGDTKIKVSDEEYIKLKDLRNDFSVYSYDPSKYYTTRVSMSEAPIATKKAQLAVRITLEDGSQIVGSGNHLMLMKDGSWKSLNDITIGDDLQEVDKEKTDGRKRSKTLAN